MEDVFVQDVQVRIIFDGCVHERSPVLKAKLPKMVEHKL